ncbi:MAG TPA: hypothetical protein DCG53_12120 [Syntrophus sp. (in: bacteria)]|nr:hypothetical protein [Syntrophus sp. (in: bacteria)]
MGTCSKRATCRCRPSPHNSIALAGTKFMKKVVMSDTNRENQLRLANIELKRQIEMLEERLLEKERIAKALQDSEKRYRRLFESAKEGILILDADTGKVVDVNPFLLQLLGYSYDALYGKHIWELGILKDIAASKDAFRVLQDNEYIRYEDLPLETISGRPIAVEFVSNVYLVDNSKVIQCDIRDISKRKEMEAQLKDNEKIYRELSIIDALSQLYNSRYFYHQLKKEIDRVNRYGEQPMTLILLDIDNFKAFNDTYGHVEGDQVILRLGQVVKRCLRQTDSAYRYGGEEFTILLPMTKSKDAVVTAERIRKEFKKEIFSPLSGQDVHVTMSLGLTLYQKREDMKTFVNRADQLMYQAKKNGKDMVCSDLLPVIGKPLTLP